MMAWERDLTKSLRDNICEYWVSKFMDVDEDVDGHPLRWNSVLRVPLPKAEKILGNALAIMDTRERKTPEIAATRCNLTLATEFAIRGFEGDNIASEVNKIMTSVQRVMLSDISSGGLSLHVVENASELDIEGPGDRLVGGVIFWDIQYRHKLGDPTKHRGEL